MAVHFLAFTVYLKALFSSVCKSEICFFVKQTISVPCIMEGRAAFFQYVFPIRILLQLFAITAGIKFDLSVFSKCESISNLECLKYGAPKGTSQEKIILSVHLSQENEHLSREIGHLSRENKIFSGKQTFIT